MDCVTATLELDPSGAARAMDALAKGTVPVRAYMLGGGLLHVATTEGAACQALLQEAGFRVHCAEMVEVDVPDEPGLLAELFNALADQFINVHVSFGIGTGAEGRIYLMLNDTARAAPVLDRFAARAA